MASLKLLRQSCLTKFSDKGILRQTSQTNEFSDKLLRQTNSQTNLADKLHRQSCLTKLSDKLVGQISRHVNSVKILFTFNRRLRGFVKVIDGQLLSQVLVHYLSIFCMEALDLLGQLLGGEGVDALEDQELLLGLCGG